MVDCWWLMGNGSIQLTCVHPWPVLGYSTGFTKRVVARDPPDEISMSLVEKKHDVLETMGTFLVP